MTPWRWMLVGMAAMVLLVGMGCFLAYVTYLGWSASPSGFAEGVLAAGALWFMAAVVCDVATWAKNHRE